MSKKSTEKNIFCPSANRQGSSPPPSRDPPPHLPAPPVEPGRRKPDGRGGDLAVETEIQVPGPGGLSGDAQGIPGGPHGPARPSDPVGGKGNREYFPRPVDPPVANRPPPDGQSPPGRFQRAQRTARTR